MKSAFLIFVHYKRDPRIDVAGFDRWKVLRNLCRSKIIDTTEFYSCIEDISPTLKIEEIILGLLKMCVFSINLYFTGLHLTSNSTLEPKSVHWEEFSHYNMWIRCFMSRNIGQMDSSWINIKLNSSFTYDIWLADPDFFLLSYNPGGTPHILKKEIKEIVLIRILHLY